MRNPLSLVFAALICSLIACSAANSGAPPADTFARPSATLERPPLRASLLDGTPAPPPALSGKFIFAPGDGSIWVQDPVEGKPSPVIKPSPEVFADAPNWSPDGKTFVYVQSSLTEQGTAHNAIYRANADGTASSPFSIPPNIQTAYNWPHYSWDGQWVYYTASRPEPPNKQHSEIQRVPVGGGNPQTLVQDARMSTESPDGKKIAFIRFNFDTFTSGLWISDLDGQNARELLNDQVFIMISAPQFSADGAQILFAASGPNTRPLPGVSFRAPTCAPAFLCVFAKSAYADGLPWDLWTVTPDGSKFTRLTDIGADSPWPAWSRDSKQIAFYDTSGQYLLDLSTKLVVQISRNGGHGVFDWWQK